MQVTFLHIYHHCLMMWAWLYVLKIGAGGDAWFGAAVNSFVHVCMYAYYLLAQLKVQCPWKKYLTQLQMAQFCACMMHSCYVLCRRNAPIGLPVVQGFVMLNMLVLFARFYQNRYQHREKDDVAGSVAAKQSQ